MNKTNENNIDFNASQNTEAVSNETKSQTAFGYTATPAPTTPAQNTTEKTKTDHELFNESGSYEDWKPGTYKISIDTVEFETTSWQDEQYSISITSEENGKGWINLSLSNSKKGMTYGIAKNLVKAATGSDLKVGDNVNNSVLTALKTLVNSQVQYTVKHVDSKGKNEKGYFVNHSFTAV